MASAALRTRSGFIITREPETGLDELNKGRLTSFLRGLTPQTIMITNTASEGFGQAISTEQIRGSVAPGTLGLDDFGVVFKTKADPVPKKQRKDQDESTSDPSEMGSV